MLQKDELTTKLKDVFGIALKNTILCEIFEDDFDDWVATEIPILLSTDEDEGLAVLSGVLDIEASSSSQQVDTKIPQ